MVKADDERKIGFQSARGRIVASLSWQRSVSPVAKPKSGLTSTLGHTPQRAKREGKPALEGGALRRLTHMPSRHGSGQRLAELAPPFFARGFFTPESKETRELPREFPLHFVTFLTVSTA
jgi:hypothetical protein